MTQGPQQNTRLDLIKQMLDWHLVQIHSGYAKPSKYIPYRFVQAEFKNQHTRAVHRLSDLKKKFEQEKGESNVTV